jgi:hypothetical protein
VPRKSEASVSPAMVRKLMLQTEILPLRRAGWSWRAIGRTVGVSHEWARRVYDDALVEAGEMIGCGEWPRS